MEASKSQKIQAEIDKVKVKISEQQARLKELEQKHREAENEEIVDIVRGMSVSLEELPLVLQRLRDSGTSGQSVQKSKFRQKSQQEQAAASKLRMEKRGEKLEAAKDKLAKQKPPKKPGPVRRMGRAAGGTVHGFVHGKLFEVEQENVGTEGAHRSELAGETALRHGSRFVKKKIREHPAKAVQRAESKYIKAAADHQFRVAAQEHPEMQGNALSRLIQNQKIKRQ